MKKIILFILVALSCYGCKVEPMSNPEYVVKMYSGDKIINEWQGSNLRMFHGRIKIDTHVGLSAVPKELCGDLEIIRLVDNKVITRTIFQCE